MKGFIPVGTAGCKAVGEGAGHFSPNGMAIGILFGIHALQNRCLQTTDLVFGPKAPSDV
jgi:hypothetical protein